ncbi:MAG: 5-(carboxyamino)imidazole ribonucleotide synthase [Flammeovirgaceae bacterium]
MSSKNPFKLGILGGGQLGRMFIQTAVNYDLHINILDPDSEAPCKPYAHEFTTGNLTDYETVIKFGEGLDLMTIEIENVNTEALETLVKKGVKVFPQPSVIKLIQDKRSQKQFYKANHIPTSEFYLIQEKKELFDYQFFLPAVQKMGKEGYDGRGVQILNTPQDFEKGFDVPGVLEKKVDIEKEISVIVAKNEKGETSYFPPVEVVYHPEKNLVDYLLAPAQIPIEIEQRAIKIALEVIEKLGMVGILAVEMFWSKQGEVLVNEIAPRPHNSGHQTIEANYTSQYEQHLRSIMNYPLGSTKTRCLSAMINLLGEERYQGKAKYIGLDALLKMEAVYLHLYGKKITKPFRKMGHITVLGNSLKELSEKIEWIKKSIKVISE